MIRKIFKVTLAILAVLVFLELAMRLAGFGFLLVQDAANRAALKNGGVRILCLGESTTAFGGNDSYPAQLERILRKRLPQLQVSVINAGRAGSNTTFILSELPGYLERYSPHVVIAMMGINDENGEYPGYYGQGRGILSWVRSLRIYKLSRLIGSASSAAWIKPWLRSRESSAGMVEGLCLPVYTGAQEEGLRRYFGNDQAAYNQYMEFRNLLSELLPGHDVESSLRYALENLPGNPWGYLSLGRCYWYRDQPQRAEEYFQKALKLAPGNDFVGLSIAACYLDHKKIAEAERIFESVASGGAPGALGYAGLAACAFARGEAEKSEALFRRSLDIDPQNWLVYAWAGNCYIKRKEYSKAESMLRRSIAVAPENAQVYFDLAQAYWLEKKHPQARKVIEDAAQKFRNNDRILSMAGNLFRRSLQPELAAAFFRKARALRLSHYNPVVRSNYRRMQDELARRKIQLVCVQYPCRKADELMKMFDSPQGIIFVDNSRVFEDSLEKYRYEELFYDSFGGDFGHCTRLGNGILAGNIADTLLREYFRR